LGADEVLDYQGKEVQGQGRVFGEDVAHSTLAKWCSRAFDIDQIWMRYWMSRLFIG
jgi:hypothetical protein